MFIWNRELGDGGKRGCLLLKLGTSLGKQLKELVPEIEHPVSISTFELFCEEHCLVCHCL